MQRYSVSSFARTTTSGGAALFLFVTTLSSPFAASAPGPARSNGTPDERASHARPLVRVAGEYGRIPLHFEPNRGQALAEAAFVSRGNGYSLYLTPSGPMLRLTAGGSAPPGPDPDAGARPAAAMATLTMRFAGGNPRPEIAGLEPLGGRVNYFRGSDPSKWLVNVPTFARVEYRDVYPGVDVLWYGNQRELEFDVVVAPGADPRAVRLDVSGARSVEIDSRGDLVLASESGQTTMRKPSLYQDGGGERQTIEGGYVLLSDRQIGFRIGSYDTSRPLVIDPVMDYSTYLGGSGFDQAYNIDVDVLGNAYVVGVTFTDDFPTTPGAFQTVRSGNDGFVTKLSPDGSTFVYSTYISGANCQGVAVDSSGSAYITGYAAIDFPTTAGAFETSLRGGFDAFVTKLSPDGSSLVYSTILGGSFDDFGYDIAIDAGGNAYVTGNTSYRAPGPGDFPTVNAFQPAYGGGTQDAFVTKVNPTGTALVYSTYLGGGAILNATEDWGEGIAVDAAGSAYVTGATYSPDFPTTAGAYDQSRAGLDAFITKFSPSGSTLVYSTFLGAAAREQGLDIAVDSSGSAYVAGLTESTDNPYTPEYDGFPTTPGAFQPRGSFDAFVTKLNPQGSGLVYSTYLGGADDVDRAWGIAINAAGNAFVVGDTKSSDFPTLDAVQPWFGGGLSDSFAAELNPAGTALVYSTFLGGNLFDEARAVALSSDGGSAYVVGSTSSFDFITTPGAAQPFNGGGLEHHDDAIVVKISSETAVALEALALSPSSVVVGSAFQGTVTLSGAAGAEGAVVALSSSKAAAATVPSSVTVPAGSSTAQFAGTTSAVAAATSVTITATYGGVTRSAVLVTTQPTTTTTTTLALNASSTTYRQNVTLTAKVSGPPGSATPTGTVRFFDGSSRIGSKALSPSGIATLSKSNFGVGAHALTAQYLGSALAGSSTSGTVTLAVSKAATTTTLASSANPAAVGSFIKYTASVAAVPPGGTPTGSVKFYDGTKVVGTKPLSGGQATLTVSYALAGLHQIKAVYVGNAGYLTSSSAVLGQAVQ